MKPLPVALSAVAGFVDAVGFLALGGFFVAFMSGNSTLLAVSLTRQAHDAWVPAGLVACFVLGVTAGSLAGRAFDTARPTAVLLLVAAMLSVAGGLHAAGWGTAAGLATALAMGAENTVFQTPGTFGTGLTYMTGTLARLGQCLAEALLHGRWRIVLPDAALWGGMVAGAVLGAVAHRAFDAAALWVAAGAVLVLAGAARRGARAE